MRPLYLLLVLGLFAVPTRAQSTRPELRVTGQATAVRRCSAGPDNTAVLVDLALRVENLGREPVILLKDAVVHQYRHAASESELATIGWNSISWYSTGDGTLRNAGRRPDRRFTVLRPGQATVLRTDLRLQPFEELPDGEYALEVSADVWFSPEAQTRELRARWAKIGNLVTGSLRSEVFHLTVSTDGPLRPCP